MGDTFRVVWENEDGKLGQVKDLYYAKRADIDKEYKKTQAEKQKTRTTWRPEDFFNLVTQDDFQKLKEIVDKTSQGETF